MLKPEERVKILRDAKPDSWIAFSSDESKLLVNADTYAEAVKSALEQGESQPIVVKTPESWAPRVFSSCL